MLFQADSQSTFGPDDPEVWKRTNYTEVFGPITLASALAMVTSRIGLVCTASAT